MRRSGKVSVVQVCLLAGIGVGIYAAYVYGPTKLRYMGMSRICDDVAHQMVTNLQDMDLILLVQSRAREEQGVELSLSQIQIRRDQTPRIVETCRIQYDDRIQPAWQKTPTVIHQVVVENASPDTSWIKDGKDTK